MDRRFHLFTRAWAVLAFALLAATWKLWTPQSSFPQIPFFEFLVRAPGWLDWVGLIVVGVSLLIISFSSIQNRGIGILFVGQRTPNRTDQQGRAISFNWFRVGCLAFALATASLISLDQNRLQPWAYHFLVLGLLIGLASPRQAIAMMRWVAISIYVYSAISKFDYQFIYTVGDQMLTTIVGFAGFETTQWPSELKRGLVILLPVGELLVGIGLALPRFRAFAAASAIGLHVTLLLILGPWGLEHRAGVLIWNLFFIVQALFLFRPGVQAGQAEDGTKAAVEQAQLEQEKAEDDRQNQILLPPQNLNWLALLLTTFVLLFPATQWSGVCDHWPGWQVYSPSSSRAQLRNGRSVSQWSLEELGVPVYPQSRFQLAVAYAAATKQAGEDQRSGAKRFQIEIGHQSNRFSGERISEVLTGADQFKMKTSKFILNTQARNNWFD